MILIDASNINSGGGESLLVYLLNSLERNRIKYFVISDYRWKNNIISDENHVIVNINIFNRGHILKKYISLIEPNTILFFGNFPPPFTINQNIKTITYIQNYFIVNWENSKYLNFLKRILLLLKMSYIKYYILNSNIYCFQNELVKNEFIKAYGRKLNIQYLVIPFFKPFNQNQIKNNFNREKSFIYVSSDTQHKNHLNLFKAWEHNFIKGIKNKLYITIDEQRQSYVVKYFQKLKKEGLPIINLGIIKNDEILKKCYKIKFAIFPSFIETIGLNLIESTFCGCKVLAPDLPYVKEVLLPSIVFDPYNPIDIAKKVEVALIEELPDSKVILKNKIDCFIKKLIN